MGPEGLGHVHSLPLSRQRNSRAGGGLTRSRSSGGGGDGEQNSTPLSLQGWEFLTSPKPVVGMAGLEGRQGAQEEQGGILGLGRGHTEHPSLMYCFYFHWSLEVAAKRESQFTL